VFILERDYRSGKKTSKGMDAALSAPSLEEVCGNCRACEVCSGNYSCLCIYSSRA